MADDSKTDLIAWLTGFIEAASAVQMVLDAQAVGGAYMFEGRHWRTTGRTSSTATQPRRNDDPILTTVLNEVGHTIRNLEGRLRVYDYTKFFGPPGDAFVATEAPEQDEKLFLARAHHARWQAVSNEQEFGGRLNLRRLIAGHAVGAFRLTRKDLRRTMGVRLDAGDIRLVLDPSNSSQSLLDHADCVEVRAVTVDEANRLAAGYLSEAGREPITSGTKIGNLIGVETYVGQQVFEMKRSSALSTAEGVLLFIVSRNFWEKRALVLYSPAYTDDAKVAHEARWEIVWPAKHGKDGLGDWEYGCDYLKLDGYHTDTMPYGRSASLALAGPQNLLNLLNVAEIRTVLFQAWSRILSVSQALEPGGQAMLDDNRSWGVIKVKPGNDVRSVLQAITFPRVDPGVQNLRQMTTGNLYREASTPSILQGEAVSREPAAAYFERRRQAMAPLEPTAATDQTRYEGFFRNMEEASVRFHGLGSSPKDKVILFGRRYVKKIARGDWQDLIDSGPISCRMKQEAFRPQTPADKEEKFWLLIQSGRMQDVAPEDANWAIQYYLQTGQEFQSGQSQACWAAHVIIRRILAKARKIGRKAASLVEAVDIGVGPYDPLDWIEHWATLYMHAAVLNDYDQAEIMALELTRLECERERLLAAESQAALRALSSNAPQGETPALGGGPAGAGPPSMAAASPQVPMAAGTPMVGGPVAVAG